MIAQQAQYSLTRDEHRFVIRVEQDMACVFFPFPMMVFCLLFVPGSPIFIPMWIHKRPYDVPSGFRTKAQTVKKKKSSLRGFLFYFYFWLLLLLCFLCEYPVSKKKNKSHLLLFVCLFRQEFSVVFNSFILFHFEKKRTCCT